jgi:hypothetical protein
MDMEYPTRADESLEALGMVISAVWRVSIIFCFA